MVDLLEKLDKLGASEEAREAVQALQLAANLQGRQGLAVMWEALRQAKPHLQLPTLAELVGTGSA